MTHDEEVSLLVQAVAEKSLQLIDKIKNNKMQLPVLVNQYIHLTSNFQDLTHLMLNNPKTVWKMQLNYWQDAMELAQRQFLHWLDNKPLPIEDKRFSDKAWLHNPFFNLLSQHYLLASAHMNALLEKIEHKDKNSAKKIQFFTKHYLDALSPSNFLHTNPQLIAETLQTRGVNLLRGLNNMLSDIELGASGLAIKMTDRSAFELGKNLAKTPGKVIFRNAMMELIQYTPQTSQVKSIPLLLIPPWINKYYILDLSPEKSFIQWLVKQGITVFVISWINPDASYAKKSLYDYLKAGPLTAIQIIKKQLAVNEVNALGYCIGGTLLAILLAYNQAHQDTSIHCATFLASMIDFSDPGDVSVFIDEPQIKKMEQEMKAKGFFSGKQMASSFNSLRANDLVWSYFIKNYLSGKNPLPFDVLYWNEDSTNMPATMHSQYLRWMYLENKLVKPGAIRLNRTQLDVSQIDLPTCFISCKGDHIAPWQTTYLGFQLMQGPKQFILGGSGHVAGIINPPALKKYSYYTNNKPAISPESWLANAIEHPGSWWPHWFKWLNKRSGQSIPAAILNHPPYKPLMDAPGSYVLKK